MGKKKQGHSQTKVSLVGAELEENLALRYMAALLESRGHVVDIVEFNARNDIQAAVNRISEFSPDIVGLSMVFTSRAVEFCDCASRLRESGCTAHIIAGGPFAAFNAEMLLSQCPSFDSVGLGEGEFLMADLAQNLSHLENVDGLCYKNTDGSIVTTAPRPNPKDLDALPFPRRTVFHEYFGKPIASILSSRGCWRNCSFCSINAWYKKSGSQSRRFRVRSVDNIVAEIKTLYFDHSVRILNFQDDNFFLPDPEKAITRFDSLRQKLRDEGMTDIAIAVKARPDSINRDAVAILDDLKLFRVFLGVENASENGLRNLNRNNTVEEIYNALTVLNDYDVHCAYNILMFEPNTTMDDIRINLRFMERHIENPYNFCRAEAYPGTGLETLLRQENRLEGDWLGYDYRLKNSQPEVFHQIANYAFFDRNFNNNGLHYFNMQVDFYFQLLRRFYPEMLSQRMRAATKNFIKETNLDTFECLSEIYDYVDAMPQDASSSMRAFGQTMRQTVDSRSERLYQKGSHLLQQLEGAYAYTLKGPPHDSRLSPSNVSEPGLSTHQGRHQTSGRASDTPEYIYVDPFGLSSDAIPYSQFEKQRQAANVP